MAPAFYTQGLVAGDGSSPWLVPLGEMMNHDAQAICGPGDHDRGAHRWGKPWARSVFRPEAS